MLTKDERDHDRRGLAKIKVRNSGEGGDYGAYTAASAAIRYLDDLDAKDEEIANLKAGSNDVIGVALEERRLAGERIVTLERLLTEHSIEIARITTLNTQQARRMVHLTVLAIGCDKHPAYRRKRPPTWPCETCRLMWEADRALKEMAQGEVKPGG